MDDEKGTIRILTPGSTKETVIRIDPKTGRRVVSEHQVPSTVSVMAKPKVGAVDILPPRGTGTTFMEDMKDRLTGGGKSGTQLPLLPPAGAQPEKRYGYEGGFDEGEDHWWSRGGGASGGGYGKPGAGYSYATTKKLAGHVKVVNAAGQTIYVGDVDSRDDDWWACATVYYTPDNEDTITITDAQCTLSEEGTIPFMACTYDAAKDYLEGVLGIHLHYTDKEWLARHPLAKDDGIPQEYTATALHALLEPYNVGVSRIRLKRGSLLIGDDLAMWIKALGCNPFAMADHSTTNAEAAAKLGMTPAEADRMFRLEFHDEPLKPSVVGESGYTTGSGVSTGSTGGHARYQPPRGSPGNWRVSVQLDRLDRIEYQVPVVLPEYVPRHGKQTLYLSAVKVPDGSRPLATMKGARWELNLPVSGAVAAAESLVEHAGKEAAPPTGPGFQQPAVPGAGAESRLEEGLKTESGAGGVTGEGADDELVVCDMCGQLTEERKLADDTYVCCECWESAWKGYTCPGCEVRFGSVVTPSVYLVTSEGTTTRIEYECPKCRAMMTRPKDDFMFDSIEDSILAFDQKVISGARIGGGREVHGL